MATNLRMRHSQISNTLSIFTVPFDLVTQEMLHRISQFYLISDAFHERNVLWQQVFPRVRKFAQSLGLHIHIVDIYHTLECAPNTLKQLSYVLEMRGTNNVALKEISLCQELSAGTTFIVR